MAKVELFGMPPSKRIQAFPSSGLGILAILALGICIGGAILFLGPLLGLAITAGAVLLSGAR